MDERSTVKKSIEEALRLDGWRKASATWFKSMAETTLVADLQKSNHSNRYFLNLGVHLRSDLGPAARVTTAPIMLRVEQLPAVGPHRPHVLLDLESPMADEDRVGRNTDKMTKWVLPQMNACSTVAALKPGGAGRGVVEATYAIGPDALFLRPDIV
jgi:hypothetical protein